MRRGPRRGERGVAMITTALVLLPLMVFAAFGVDLASWYSRISYLQKSADAAALAGTVWMPDLAKATAEAKRSLRSNGIVDKDEGGTDDIDVVIERGSTPTALRVVVTDNSATRYFSQIFRGDQELSRSAEAEYNLPIPLGSPLNYFGGDASKNTTIDEPVVDWPRDVASRRPWNLDDTGPNPTLAPTAPCRVSDDPELGGWSGSPPAWSAATFDPSWQPCVWSARPADYDTRRPLNEPCNVFGRDTTTDGRWAGSSFRGDVHFTGAGTPGNRQCYWNLPGLLPPDWATRQPTNVPCNVLGVADPYGRWRIRRGRPDHQSGQLHAADSADGKLCEWTADIDTVQVPAPDQIDPTRSPGFWAMIEGPGTVATQGDAYSPRCYLSVNCGAVQNASYRDTADPNRGYWYVVKIPSGLSGAVDIRVFDASHDPDGEQDVFAGDISINARDQHFETEFRVYEQTNPLDFTIREPVPSGNDETALGNCHWRLGDETSFRGAWRRLCTLNGVSPGDVYLVNVRTNGNDGSGVNGYALEACANGSCATGAQPALYAFGDMSMYNNVAAGDATFYLAEVGPQYAGKTLVLELWDAGDATGNATIYPMMPSASVPAPVVHVPPDQCEYTSSPSPNEEQTSSPGGPTGVVHDTPQSSDETTRCAIRTTISGNRQFNGEWLRIRVAIPPDYTCEVGRNPELQAGSCWWGIKYSFSSSTTDVTTWQARIEGNPVHLTR